jgi:predicted CXXCH cytochrome family protein
MRPGLATLPLFLALAAAPASALMPPHDSSNGIDCPSCHAVHGANGQAFMPLAAVQEALCKSCHNPTGQAASMADVAVHVVAGGTRILFCGDCHDAHSPSISVDPHSGGATAPNLSLMRSDVTAAVAGAASPLVFQQRPGQFAFGAGSAPWDGACQACHSATAHHTRDATGDHDHAVGSDCTTCHRHVSGFLAPHCTDCHAVPQDDGNGIPAGGRRAVVGEFPAGPVHGHLLGPAVADDDCKTCHGLSRHQTGTIELLDPDGGASYFFVQAADLTHDPDVSNFCMGCHDADGARRLAGPGNPLDPFGTGVPPSAVASRFSGTLQWLQVYTPDSCFGGSGTGRPVNSHHDVSDADQAFSGAKLECLSCHSAHGSSTVARIADPDAPLAPWTGTVSAFCMRCHHGGTGPASPGFPAGVIGPSTALTPLDSCGYTGAPWWVDVTYPHSAHGAGSKRSWPGYSGGPAYDMACTICHDPHGSATPTNPAGNPYMIRDVVDGTALVDDGVRGVPWFGPPWNAFGLSRTVEIPVGIDGLGQGRVDFGGDTGLCSACHSAWQQVETFIHGNPGQPPGCFNCSMCHAHGQIYGEYDWVNWSHQQVCP